MDRASASPSSGVVFIFQFPAITGLRLFMFLPVIFLFAM
jgi:hypothetical protein